LPLSAASLILTIIMIVVFQSIGHALSFSLAYTGITNYDLVKTGILSTLTAAAFSVPRALTPQRGQRYIEAFLNSLIVSVVLVAWFFFVPTKAVLTFYGTESSSPSPYASDVASLPGIIAVLAGMTAGRLAAGLFSSSFVTWRAIYSSVVAGAGWGLVFLWVTAAAVALWFDETNSTPVMAVHGSVAVLAGLAAYGWRDGAAQRRNPSKLDRAGWFGASNRPPLSALITALGGWLLMLACAGASFVITLTEIQKETFNFNKGFKPIERVAIDNKPLKIDCTTGKQIIFVDQVKIGTYYKMSMSECNNNSISIFPGISANNKLTDQEKNAILSQIKMVAVDDNLERLDYLQFSESNGYPRIWFNSVPSNIDNMYLCISVYDDFCAYHNSNHYTIYGLAKPLIKEATSPTQDLMGYRDTESELSEQKSWPPGTEPGWRIQIQIGPAQNLGG
jgi:hypothetical protein